MCGAWAEMAFKVFGSAPALRRAIQHLEPALIHAHFGVDGAYILPVATSLEVPLIITFHGFDATIKDDYARKSYYGFRLYLRRRERLKQRARLFIAVSKFVKGKLVERGFPEDKIIVHYVGVDTDRFNPNPHLRREPVILFVGRLSEEKGCEHLISVVAKVQEVVRDVKMVVIGSGPLATACNVLRGKSYTVTSFWVHRTRRLSATG